MKRVLAAGGVVINQYNEILMIYRRTIWDLPKGHLEKDETLEQCALREVREETGLKTLKLVSFIGISEHMYFDSKINQEVIKETHWYEIRGDKGERLHPLEIESIEWVRWINARQVMGLSHLFENLKPIIQKSSLFR